MRSRYTFDQNGMTHPFLAVNYRTDSDTMGCWKGCKNEWEAISWLNWRKGKTPSSPDKGAVFACIDEIEAIAADTTCISLKKSLEAYLGYLTYFNHLKSRPNAISI